MVLIAAWFVHSWRTPNPLIDLRTFAHTRAGAAAGTFLLFAISVFGTMLLVPLYYQTVRGASALQAGLLLAPGGFGAMLMMPLVGPTDRPVRTHLAARHRPAVRGDRADPVRVRRRPHLLRSAVRRQLRSGPRDGAGDDAEHDRRDAGGPAAAIARTSTAMNIIRQGGASIGTAVLSVILASAITSNLSEKLSWFD